MSVFELKCEVAKVDDSLGIVFGWGIICSENGEPYIDLQEDHIREPNMLKAAAKFADGDRVAKEMHQGGPAGTVLFVYPLTAEIAKSLGLETKRTGMLVGMRPVPEMLAKFKSGELRGFSIGGRGTRRRVEPSPA